MHQIAVFVSGNGSNCERIIRHFAESEVGRVTLVVSNRADAFALQRAERLGVPAVVIEKGGWSDEQTVMRLLRSYGVDFIVLAGFLLKVPDYLVAAYDRRMVNLHPSLLPKYGGKGMWGHHVHEAVAAHHERETGISIHYVSSEIDGGEIIAQFRTPLSPNDTPATIEAKVHSLELAHFAQVIEETLLKVCSKD